MSKISKENFNKLSDEQAFIMTSNEALGKFEDMLRGKYGNTGTTPSYKRAAKKALEYLKIDDFIDIDNAVIKISDLQKDFKSGNNPSEKHPDLVSSLGPSYTDPKKGWMHSALRHFLEFLFKNEVGLLPSKKSDDVIEKIADDETLTGDTKLQLIRARVNQGIFRKRILEKFDGKCMITGLSNKDLLIAGHIKPWAKCNNNEKLSRENGILLTPTYDRLFDKGFISFSDEGELLVSNNLDENDLTMLGINKGQKYNLIITLEMKGYLNFHRKKIFKN